MNRRRYLGAVGTAVVGGDAGCAEGTCDCPPRRELGLADLRVVGDDPARLETTVDHFVYEIEDGPFRDLSLVLLDAGKRRIGSVPIGDVAESNGFDVEVNDGGCCPGESRRYERPIAVALGEAPVYVVFEFEANCSGGDEVEFYEAGDEDGSYRRRRGSCADPVPPA